MRLALLALDIGAGDEVIVPSNTFIATWLIVSQTGAVPVPVEPNPATYNIDPGRFFTALTTRTRATIPVHLCGQPNDRRRVIAQRYLTEICSTDLVLPQVRAWCDPVWHLFVVRHPQRDALKRRLADSGIVTQVHYLTAIHAQCAYRAHTPGSFPLAGNLAAEVLSLPIGPQMSSDQVNVMNETSR